MSFRTVLSLILFAQTLFGQSLIKLDGYVRDATGQPLSDVYMEIIGGMGVYTDSHGYFYFENLFAGEYPLKVEKIGYEKQILTVVIDKDSRLSLQLVLREKILTGPSILVENTSFIPPGAIDLETEQIRRSPASNTAELLKQLPSVRTVTDGNGAQHISIRGSALNQVLVLLDGVVLNDPLSGTVDISRIPTGNIVHIRLLKGNQSARYGSGAIGGVLLISTRPSSTDKTRLSVLGGSFGLFNIQVESSLSPNDFNFNLGGGQSVSKGDYPYCYLLADGAPKSDIRLNAGFRESNLHGDMGYNQGANRFRIFIRWQESNRGLPGQVFTLTPYATAGNRQKIIGAAYSYAQGHWFNRLNVQYHDNSTRYKNYPAADAPLKYRSAPPYDSRYRIQTLQLANQTTLSFWNKQVGVLRLELRQDDFDEHNYLSFYPGGGIAKTRNRNEALVLQNEWHPPKPAFLQTLQIGHAMRLDYFKISGAGQNVERTQISPDISLTGIIFSKVPTKFSMRYGRGFRMPTFADLFYQDFRVRGNAELLPETSRSVEGGLESTLSLWGPLKLSAAYFDNKIDNLILWQLGSFSTWQPVNTNARISGWEFGFSWRIWKDHILLTGDDNILSPVNKSGERTTNGKDLTYRPRHNSKIGIDLNFGEFHFRWQQRSEGLRYITASNTVSLPGYSVQDITLNYKWDIHKTTVYFRAAVYNLTDRHYEISEHAPMQGRNGRIGVETRF